jgi:hypothetical protein
MVSSTLKRAQGGTTAACVSLRCSFGNVIAIYWAVGPSYYIASLWRSELQ